MIWPSPGYIPGDKLNWLHLQFPLLKISIKCLLKYTDNIKETIIEYTFSLPIYVPISDILKVYVTYSNLGLY